MLRWLLRAFGLRAMRSALRNEIGGRRPPLLDFGLGLALFRDRRVSIGLKALALLLGGLIVAGLVALELPVEALVGLLLNIPGIGIDAVVDGLEVIAGPLLFGALLLTRLAPAQIVERLRAERYPMPAR